MILVDTSIWIEHLRAGTSFRLDEAIDFDDVVTCLPVIQEVLQGVRDQRAYLTVREAMLSLPRVESPMEPDLYELAIDLFRRARRAGLTVRSSVDCLIGACALRNSLMILHRDRDYPALAAVAPIEHRDQRF